MKNGFVVPPKGKRRNPHTSHLSFMSYVQLRLLLDKYHSAPSQAVTQHDHDKMDYLEGYHAFKMVKNASEEDLRLISGIISLLYAKHVITKSEEVKFISNYLGGLKHE